MFDIKDHPCQQPIQRVEFVGPKTTRNDRDLILRCSVVSLKILLLLRAFRNDVVCGLYYLFLNFNPFRRKLVAVTLMYFPYISQGMEGNYKWSLELFLYLHCRKSRHPEIRMN